MSAADRLIARMAWTRQQQQEEEAEAFSLTHTTPDGLRREAAMRDLAAKVEQAYEDSGVFVLTGSDRAADAPNQGSLI